MTLFIVYLLFPIVVCHGWLIDGTAGRPHQVLAYGHVHLQLLRQDSAARGHLAEITIWIRQVLYLTLALGILVDGRHQRILIRIVKARILLVHPQIIVAID